MNGWKWRGFTVPSIGFSAQGDGVLTSFADTAPAIPTRFKMLVPQFGEILELEFKDVEIEGNAVHLFFTAMYWGEPINLRMFLRNVADIAFYEKLKENLNERG